MPLIMAVNNFIYSCKFDATTLSILTFSITTLSIMTFSLIIIKRDTQLNSTLYRVSKCWVSFMLKFIYAECHKKALYSKCHYAGCNPAECLYARCYGAVVELLTLNPKIGGSNTTTAVTGNRKHQLWSNALAYSVKLSIRACTIKLFTVVFFAVS